MIPKKSFFDLTVAEKKAFPSKLGEGLSSCKLKPLSARDRALWEAAKRGPGTTGMAVHEGSGNVFADLGIANHEEYLAKAELAARILRIVQSCRLTQTAAGRVLGISQPKVSALLHGRLDGFSTDRLFRFLNNLGCDVQINVSKARPRCHGRVLIMAG